MTKQKQRITKDQIRETLQTIRQTTDASLRSPYPLQKDYILSLRKKFRGEDRKTVNAAYCELLVDHNEFDEMVALAKEGCLEQIVDLLRQKNPDHVSWREERIAELYEGMGMEREARLAYATAAEQTEPSCESAIELWKKAGDDKKSKQAEREFAKARLVKLTSGDKNEKFLSSGRVEHLREELGKLREYFFELGLRDDARKTIDALFEIRAKGSSDYRTDYTSERAIWLRKLGDEKEARNVCLDFAREAESDLKELISGWNKYGNNAFNRDTRYASTSVKYRNHISEPFHIAASFYAESGDDKKAKQLLLEYKDWAIISGDAQEFEVLYERYGLLREFIEIAQKTGYFEIGAKFAEKHGMQKTARGLFRKAAEKAGEEYKFEDAIKFWSKTGDKKSLQKAYRSYAESLRPSWDSPEEHAYCARIYALAGDPAKAAEVIREGMLGNWEGGKVLDLDKCGGQYSGVDSYLGARRYLPQEAKYRLKAGQIDEAKKIYAALGDSKNFLRLNKMQQGAKK
jgi:NADH:ubiquinone oxidoreductase subunit C